MTESISEADALRRFPELEALVAIRDAGWNFRHAYDDQNKLSCVMGSFSRQQYTDAIFIVDRRNVSAARVLDEAYGGGCVWTKESSSLEEIVHELLGLPAPGQPGAPSLVKAKNVLWTP